MQTIDASSSIAIYEAGQTFLYGWCDWHRFRGRVSWRCCSFRFDGVRLSDWLLRYFGIFFRFTDDWVRVLLHSLDIQFLLELIHIPTTRRNELIGLRRIDAHLTERMFQKLVRENRLTILSRWCFQPQGIVSVFGLQCWNAIRCVGSRRCHRDGRRSWRRTKTSPIYFRNRRQMRASRWRWWWYCCFRGKHGWLCQWNNDWWMLTEYSLTDQSAFYYTALTFVKSHSFLLDAMSESWGCSYSSLSLVLSLSFGLSRQTIATSFRTDYIILPSIEFHRTSSLKLSGYLFLFFQCDLTICRCIGKWTKTNGAQRLAE